MGTAGPVGVATVRPARLADAARIGAVHVQGWRETYAGLMSPERLASLDPGDRAAMWRGQLAGGLARGVAVAELDGAIVGFAACMRQRTPTLAAAGYAGEITALYVLRAAQRNGAGRLLIRAMARRLIAEGTSGLGLWVLTANAPARRFYERLGGIVIARRVDGADAETGYGWSDLAAMTRA